MQSGEKSLPASSRSCLDARLLVCLAVSNSKTVAVSAILLGLVHCLICPGKEFIGVGPAWDGEQPAWGLLEAGTDGPVFQAIKEP